MWLSLLNGLLKALNAWQEGRQRNADRQAGRDDLSTQISAGVLKRAKEARAIESDNNGDEWLRPPNKRPPNSE